jgi:hypothetical protein
MTEQKARAEAFAGFSSLVLAAPAAAFSPQRRVRIDDEY